MGPLDQLSREVEELRRDMALMRKVLVRQGVVQSVTAVTGTVVVQFPGTDATGLPAKSLPVPWFQRGTEHRPPAMGDHALVIDPSLGNGGGVALIGWPSTLRPPPAAGVKTLLYSGSDAVGIDSTSVALGSLLPTPPVDFAANATLVDQFITTLYGMLSGWAPVSNDGGAALKAAFTASFPLPPASVAATEVKVK